MRPNLMPHGFPPTPFCWEGVGGWGRTDLKKILLLGEGSGDRMGKFPVWGLNLGRVLPGSMSKNDHFLLFDLEI